MSERLTWEEIQEKYPDQWVGMVDVKYMDDDGVSVESGVVKYVDTPEYDLLMMAVRGEAVVRYTNPDGVMQVGVLM